MMTTNQLHLVVIQIKMLQNEPPLYPSGEAGMTTKCNHQSCHDKTDKLRDQATQPQVVRQLGISLYILIYKAFEVV